MKNLFYNLFAFFFNVSRILPLKKNRIVLLSPHKGGSHDSLGEMKSYIKSRGGYEIIEMHSPFIDNSSFAKLLGSIFSAIKFFLSDSRKLARAKYVFLNDNFMPMAQLNFSNDSVITQLWHAEGAFKKFGLLSNLSDNVKARELKAAEKLSFVTCTSHNLIETYARAFGVPKEKVIPVGSPRLDYLLGERDKALLRKEFDEKMPQFKGKKLILYAPTFRDNPQRDKDIINHIDFDLFTGELSDDYALLVKLHPQIHSGNVPKENDVTNFDIADLTMICDMVITDYSSVCMDFTLLKKRCIFYAFDKEEYEAERSFCFGYDDYVPGPVVTDFESLLSEIKNPKSTGNDAFEKFNFDYIDDKNCERVFNAVIDS